VFDEKGNKLQNFTLLTQKEINENQREYNNLKKNEEIIAQRIAELKPPELKLGDFKVAKAKVKKEDKTEFLFEFFPFDANGKLKPEQQGELLKAIDGFTKDFGAILQGVNFRTIGGTNAGAIDAAKKWWADFQKGIVQFKPEKIVADVNFVPTVPTFEGKPLEQLRAGLDQAINKEGQQPFDLNRTRDQILDDYKLMFAAIGQKLPDIVDINRSGLDETVPLGTVVNEEELKKGLEAELKRIKGVMNEFNTNMKSIFREGKSQLFISLGEGLGDVLSGKGLGGLFSGIVSTMGSILQQLGEQLIKTAVAIKAFKSAFKSLLANPALAIGVGIGLIAIGGAIKASSQKLKGFADGGLVFGPTLGLIGEGRGTNKSNPEVIAPLDRLQAMLAGTAGGSQTVVVMGRLRGKDILLQNARTIKSQRRLS
jgi:hypothetical protein